MFKFLWLPTQQLWIENTMATKIPEITTRRRVIMVLFQPFFVVNELSKFLLSPFL